MLAHYHAQIWNAAEPARTLGVTPSTCRRYLDLLSDAQMLRQLQPWHTNLSKRQVKTPKLYFYDVGLAAYLLGVESELHVNRHPLRGNLFENLVVIDNVVAAWCKGLTPHNCEWFET